MNNLSLEQFYSSAENIDRACSTVIENSISIFLPFKRLDKTDIHRRFISNNQILEIDNNLFDKVEIRGRLLGQGHKDILEALLTSSKIFIEDTRQFKINTTAYEITKRLGRNIGKKKWLIQQLKEIAEARINIYFKDNAGKNIDFNFNFISSILGENEDKLSITFSQEYTHFLAKTELLDYSNYVSDIVKLDSFTKQLTKKLGLKIHNINSDFLKAIVRYMLIHKGNNSQIKIDNLIDKLNLNNLISKEQLKDYIYNLKRDEIQAHLKQKFGITLTSNNETITFNTPENKTHYIINNK